jgi:phosphatidyl-myo-inositol dimannoside synthase
MRAALFSYDYAPLDGGIARLCTELHRGLLDKGVDVSVFTAPNGADSSEAPGIQRISGSRLVRDARAVRLLTRLPADATVLCGRWYPEGLLALLARRRSVIILAHGAELLASRVVRTATVQEAVRRRVLEAAQLVIANSRYTAELVTQIAPRARVQAIPLGVDTDTFQPGDRVAARAKLGLSTRFVIATVARVLSFKGHDTVISAIARLPPALRSDFTYYIAGRGSHVGALSKLAADLGVTQQIRFAGLVPEHDLADVYRAADLFCLMTRLDTRAVEGFGLALLEAQSCGVPVLGTMTGGIPDAVEDGVTGFLLPPGDTAGVESHLRRLALDPERYRQIGLAGRNRATSRCTWSHYSDRLLSAMQRARGSDRQSAADMVSP